MGRSWNCENDISMVERSQAEWASDHGLALSSDNTADNTGGGSGVRVQDLRERRPF